jgi:hypothetical protein
VSRLGGPLIPRSSRQAQLLSSALAGPPALRTDGSARLVSRSNRRASSARRRQHSLFDLRRTRCLRPTRSSEVMSADLPPETSREGAGGVVNLKAGPGSPEPSRTALGATIDHTCKRAPDRPRRHPHGAPDGTRLAQTQHLASSEARCAHGTLLHPLRCGPAWVTSVVVSEPFPLAPSPRLTPVGPGRVGWRMGRSVMGLTQNGGGYVARARILRMVALASAVWSHRPHSRSRRRIFRQAPQSDLAPRRSIATRNRCRASGGSVSAARSSVRA